MSRIVMKNKTIICLAVAMAAVGTGCEKSGGLEVLPFLEKVDDVCTKMDDIEFMAYCYENFDVNDDGKVSMTEANAVRSIGANARTFAGIEYFSNLESFSSFSVEEVDLRYNKELTSILFRNCENLKTVRMPESLPNLSKLDFYGCSSLISIAIPDGVSSIENITFSDAILKVPAKSVEAYKNSSWASHFGIIKPL